jgi:hypothetical protein
VPEPPTGWISAAATASRCSIPERIAPATAREIVQAIAEVIAPVIVQAIAVVTAPVPLIATEAIVRARATALAEIVRPRPIAAAKSQVQSRRARRTEAAAAALRRAAAVVIARCAPSRAGRPVPRRPAAGKVLQVQEDRAAAAVRVRPWVVVARARWAAAVFAVEAVADAVVGAGDVPTSP